MSISATWRDRVLLISAWAIVLFFVLGMWAFSPNEIAEGPDAVIRPGVGLVLAVFFAPLIAITLTLGAQGKSRLQAFREIFQSRKVFVALLIGLALGEIYYIFVDIETFSSESLAIVAISLALIIHLFAGRSSVDVKIVVFLVVWFVSLVLARQSLSELLAVGNFWSASWRYQAFVLALTSLIALFALLPIAHLSSRLTAAAKALVGRFAPYFGWLFLITLGFSLLIFAFNQSTDFERLQPVLLGRIFIVLTAVLASISALGQGASPEQNASTYLKDLWGPAYIGSLVVVALGFLFVSSLINMGGINPDGLSYLNIARSYAAGNPVVRGYWSPLISWLMAPIIALGADPIAVYKGLIQAATLMWILITLLIARRWGLKRYTRVALSILISLISLTHGFALITPDLLGAVFFGFGFYLLTDPRLAVRPVQNGVIIGIALALSYYAKYYNLAFFIALIPALILLMIARGEKVANSLKVAGISLATAALLILPWALGMWSRYGQVTITTSAAISRAVVGPNSRGHVCWVDQLCDGPHDVLFPGEDPQLQYYSDAGWSPFENIPSLRHQIRLVWNGALMWIEPSPIGPHPIPPVMLIALILLPLLSRSNKGTKFNYSLGLVVFGLYAAGYLFTFGSALRYYLPIIPVAWLALSALIEKGLFAALPNSLPRWVYPLSIAAILAIPILAFSWFATIRFRVQAESNTCLEDSAYNMASYLLPPIAGTDESIHYIAYYTRIPTRGAAPVTTPTSSFDSQLRAMGVQTLVTPAETEFVDQLIAKFNYLSLQEVEVCGAVYDVLRVP